jgi:hypothetical protein
MMSTAEELRGYLGRLLGWTNTSAIEHALRSVELAKEHRAQLVLCGQGDLVPLAHGLHRRAFGAEAPFIVCDPHRGNTPASVRSPANVTNAAEAFDAAAGGSLCIRRRRPPRDFPVLVARLRSSSRVQYICLDQDSLQWLVRPGPIEVPCLVGRREELPRIVDEYMLDAVQSLAPEPRTLSLSDDDRRWLIEHAAQTSLGEIEKATLRLVALRCSPSISRAAARLGMAAVSLSRWAARRKLASSSCTASAA